MADGFQGGGGPTLGQSQSQPNLTSAKEARKRAELDAQLLANRIALLKQEEEKAWKKIDETRKRASEITDLRSVNESKFAQKEQFYEGKWDSIRAAQAQNAYNRDKGRAIREAAKQGLIDSRTQIAHQAKQRSHQHLLMKKDREAQERQANIERGNLIKQRKLDSKRKMEEDRLKQLESFRGDYDKRTATEELLHQRTDSLVARMEQEEMLLIQRLQNTQTVQRNAYEELERALGQNEQQGQQGSSSGMNNVGVGNGY